MSDRILVIDDDEELAELLGILLTKRGYETEVAFSGRDAVEKAVRFRPAVIIQDYMLPDIKGVELLGELQKGNPDAFVIVITARGSESVAVEMLKAGASDYVKKPFDTDSLVITVENMLRLRSSQFECTRLASELKQQNRELLGINALSAALTSSMGRDSKCGSAVDIIMSNMRADMANVFIKGPNGSELKLMASHCRDGEGFKDGDYSGKNGLASYICEIKKPAVVSEISSEKRIKMPEKVLELGMTSALAVPMMYKDGFRGVLEVYTREPRSFPSFDIKLLSSFANLIAMALENESLSISLSMAQKRWQATCDVIPDRITVQDSSHKIVCANRAAAESAGVEVKDLLGQQCCWMFHNTKEPVGGCPVSEVFDTKNPASREVRMESSGQSYRIDAYPVLDGDGNITMVVERGQKLPD